MQRTEHNAGFGTPEGGPLSEHIRTAVFAIEAGIKTDDWNCIAEAQVMPLACVQRARESERYPT
ncbi:MAG TPA: hypothetical protein VKK81_27780 [Candidatus Binatia bacterium]|nr:hypothetical protein [Candidatus Binatia bacterium]